MIILGCGQKLEEIIKICDYFINRVYVDVVFNHMTGVWEGASGIGGSQVDTVNKYYPDVPYGPNDFNPTCSINNYNDPNNVSNHICIIHNLIGFYIYVSRLCKYDYIKIITY